jgi:galactokinase/mevalonate kinase-like predicted kinase
VKSLLATIVSVIKPQYGFDLYLRSDFRWALGLGGSSAATTATIAVFNELRQDRWSTYEIAELAFQAERLCFGIAGWQDQYASAFGGFNLIEFENQRNLVHPIRLEEAIRNELESCLVLCDTGIPTTPVACMICSARRCRPRLANRPAPRQRGAVPAHAPLSDSRRAARFRPVPGRSLAPEKALSSAISHGRLDEIYAAALAAGALGGKLLGAGGGGFFLFYVQPQHRQRGACGARTGLPDSGFRFESCGVTSGGRKSNDPDYSRRHRPGWRACLCHRRSRQQPQRLAGIGQTTGGCRRAAGADCVKFQLRNREALYRRKADGSRAEDLGVEYIQDLLDKVELSLDEHRQLRAYCAQQGITYLCTPWMNPVSMPWRRSTWRR